jgi:predicted RNase H-like HicB family nuclease
MTTEPRYHINIFWSDEDDCWIADVPDLRPCSAHGDTPEEALAEIQIVIGMWFEWAKDSNVEPPEPRYRSAIYNPA